MIRRRLHGPEDQAVTFVELFFDLVFVFAVTEITALTASHLNWTGVARSILLFWLIWWAWTQFTWTLNPADTNHDLVRIITLVATGVAFIMATSVTPRVRRPKRSGSSSRTSWSACSVSGSRCGSTSSAPQVERGSVAIWASLSLIGLTLVLAGAFVDPPARNWIWLAAIGADLIAAGSGAVVTAATGTSGPRTSANGTASS